MSASTAHRRAYREVTTRREDQMSAQPDHAPVTPYAPAPGAPAELLAQLRADRRAAQWVAGLRAGVDGRPRGIPRHVLPRRAVRGCPGVAGPPRLRPGRRRVRRLRLRRQRVHRHGGGTGKAPVTAQQPYAVCFSAPAAKVLATLPEHVEDMVWDVLDAAARRPVGLPPVERRRPRGRGRPPRLRRPALPHLLGEPSAASPVHPHHHLARIATRAGALTPASQLPGSGRFRSYPRPYPRSSHQLPRGRSAPNWTSRRHSRQLGRPFTRQPSSADHLKSHSEVSRSVESSSVAWEP